MSLSRRTVPVCLAAALALSLAGASAAVAGPPGSTDDGTPLKPRPAEAPVVDAPQAGTPVPGQYVVVFRPGTRGVEDLARDLTREQGGQLLHTYEHAVQGFAARMPEGKAAALRRNPNVLLVEQDAVASVADTQTGATWGLDRSDQRNLPLDRSYTDGNEGVGVHVYVIDTGVLATHTEFAGRMGNGYDAVTAGGAASDCNGHGTHVAGTAAGATYGIADKATVHAVRVLGCNGSGTNAGVIAGVDWVRANRVRPAVANMSLGGGASTALDTAVNNAIAAGVTFAVAAGNENTNACGGSPSRVPAAVTVGSTTSTDARSSFSNYGTCLDLFAPGSSITSAWYTGTTATNTISGTSMATPHVAGAAALYLSANPQAAPQTVRDAIVARRHADKVTGAQTGSPNVLLHTRALHRDACTDADADARPERPGERRLRERRHRLVAERRRHHQLDEQRHPGPHRHLVGVARRLQRRERADRADGDGPQRRRDPALVVAAELDRAGQHTGVRRAVRPRPQQQRRTARHAGDPDEPLRARHLGRREREPGAVGRADRLHPLRRDERRVVPVVLLRGRRHPRLSPCSSTTPLEPFAGARSANGSSGVVPFLALRRGVSRRCGRGRGR